MSLPIKFRKLAEVQIANTFNSYLAKSARRAQMFLDCLDERLDELSENPHSCQVQFDDVRKALLPDFPYQLLYAVRTVNSRDRIVILGCVHEKSNPETWRELI
jgi:plasmid stabilization system protein ParE